MKIGIVLLMILFSTGAFGLEAEQVLYKMQSKMNGTAGKLQTAIRAFEDAEDTLSDLGRKLRQDSDNMDKLKEKLRECENNQKEQENQQSQQY